MNHNVDKIDNEEILVNYICRLEFKVERLLNVLKSIQVNSLDSSTARVAKIAVDTFESELKREQENGFDE